MRRDNGFTLVELLIAIVIMGVITVPLVGVIVGYLHNSITTSARLSESNDAQITAAYWTQDVASIGTRSTTSPFALNQSVFTTDTTTYPCAVTNSTPIVRFVWDDYLSGPGPATQISVAYVTEHVGVGNQIQLHRLKCSGSSTVSTDHVLAVDLVSTTLPVVTCVPMLCTGTGSNVPRSVTLTLYIKDPNDTTSSYTVQLTGVRRQT